MEVTMVSQRAYQAVQIGQNSGVCVMSEEDGELDDENDDEDFESEEEDGDE